MHRVSPRGYALTVVLTVSALITIYFFFGEEPNSAQERPAAPRSATFDQFSKSDEITDAVRDRKKEIVRIQFHSIADRDRVTKFGRIVQDFGTSVVLVKNTGTD